jgi:hypothetical protein
MSVQTAQRLSDGQELVRFDLLARRLAPQITEDEVWSWFDRAHECIITTFVSSTDPDIQEKYWERYQYRVVRETAGGGSSTTTNRKQS